VKVPDDAVVINGDSLTIHFKDVLNVDQLRFPGGTGTAPVKVTFEATYTKTGSARSVRPTSRDPLSPFNWAGNMWMATNSGTFSVSYTDGSFSASGSFSSSGNFGEMGTERNGSFVTDDDHAAANTDFSSSESQTTETELNQMTANQSTGVRYPPRLKGRVPRQ
jgi:hypothetical protein